MKRGENEWPESFGHPFSRLPEAPKPARLQLHSRLPSSKSAAASLDLEEPTLPQKGDHGIRSLFPGLFIALDLKPMPEL